MTSTTIATPSRTPAHPSASSARADAETATTTPPTTTTTTTTSSGAPDAGTARPSKSSAARARAARAYGARKRPLAQPSPSSSSTSRATRGLARKPKPPADEGISDAVLEQALKATGVKSSPTPFPGSHLYTPGDGKPHPAILMLHGSEGGDAGYSDLQAIALAKQGFTVLAFDYFGKSEGLPKELANVEIHRAVDAAHWLAGTPDVDGKKVGLFGVSRGAEQALLLASLEKDDKTFAAVAAHAPHATVVGSYDPKTGGPVMADGKEAPAWLVDGKPKPNGAIEIEKYQGPVFLSHGTADELWDAGQTRALERRLERNGKRAEVHLYPGEGHVFGFRAGIDEQKALVAFFRRTLGD